MNSQVEELPSQREAFAFLPKSYLYKWTVLQEFSDLLSLSQNTEAFFLRDFFKLPYHIYLSLTSHHMFGVFFLILSFEPENILTNSFSWLFCELYFQTYGPDCGSLSIGGWSERNPKGHLTLQVDDHLPDCKKKKNSAFQCNESLQKISLHSSTPFSWDTHKD